MLGVAAAIRRAQQLTVDSGRVLIGLTGAPGSGKSTLGAQLVGAPAAGATAVLVPMDGFHLAQCELIRLGIADRKGSPDTFDASGYVALLRRISEATDAVVYAPAFDRGQEEPIAGAIAVPAHANCIVTEGNYLLLDAAPWRGVREVTTEIWFCEIDDELRRSRLVARHQEFGKSAQEAAAWVARVDETNAALVAATRHAADVIVAI